MYTHVPALKVLHISSTALGSDTEPCQQEKIVGTMKLDAPPTACVNIKSMLSLIAIASGTRAAFSTLLKILKNKISCDRRVIMKDCFVLISAYLYD